MSFEHAEAMWLDEHGELTLVELTQCSGLTAREIGELVELGALVPTQGRGADPMFSSACIAAARTAARLRDHFEVDAHGLALALTLLERIQTLESELRAASAQLPRRVRP